MRYALDKKQVKEESLPITTDVFDMFIPITHFYISPDNSQHIHAQPYLFSPLYLLVLR